MAQDSYEAGAGRATASSGQGAVDAAAAGASMAEANAAAPAQFAEEGVELRAIGDRAFLYKDGVWTETTFDPDTMETVRVEFASGSTSHCWPSIPIWRWPSPWAIT